MNQTGEMVRTDQDGQSNGRNQVEAMDGTNQSETVYAENAAECAGTKDMQDHTAYLPDAQDQKADTVEQAVTALIQAIHESAEYTRYQKIRAKVHELPELEQKIHAFRKKNYETQNSTDEWNLYDRVDELEREGAEFRKDPLVDEYLSAELAICRLYQNINWTIVGNIDFDIGFTIDK